MRANTPSLRTGVVLALLASMLACRPAEQSPRGFRLPPGDPAAGRAAFLDLECFSCHRVAGEDFPAPTEAAEVVVQLGGPTAQVRTYGELVTSIVNPSHRVAPGYRRRDTFADGESRMAVYNETMTVEELIDLVSYLQPLYQLVGPDLEAPMP